MAKKITKATLVREPKYDCYVRIDENPVDGGLTILDLFFTGCVDSDVDRIRFIKEQIIRGDVVGCNDVGATIIDGKFQFGHDVIQGLDEPRLTKEELLALVDKWFELVAAKAETIVITNDNGKFSIGTE